MQPPKPLSSSLFHSTSITQALADQGSSTEGLDVEEAAKRLIKTGANQINEAAKESWILKLLRQFKSAVVVVLIIAVILSGLIGEWVEAVAILFIVAFNGILGFLQEARAEKELASLKRLSAPQARVLRSGEDRLVPAAELVPGDIIEVEAGDLIPADCRLISENNLRTQEASLTGESTPVSKDPQVVLNADTSLADRVNMVFSGTTVLLGDATAIVVATGMSTELGKIAGLLEAETREPTPLQRRLAELGHVLMLLCLMIVLFVSFLQWYRGGNLSEIFIFSISLAVAAVPEGLPAVVTIALAFGLTRMAARNALIRRLPSVETLGSVTVICSDKTGTLTRNEMTVTKIITGHHGFRIEGVGYSPEGGFRLFDSSQPISFQDYPDLLLLLKIGAICNHSKVSYGDTGWQVIGDPTEGALVVAAMKADVSFSKRDESIVKEFPFDAERKMMSVVLRSKEGKIRLFTKGAPEELVKKCENIQINGVPSPWTSEQKQSMLRHSQSMASDALRVLAFAYRDCDDIDIDDHDLESNLTFVGLVGMIDPPRDEAKIAVRKCQEAGIKPIMITGDHPATGLAVAREIGIAQENDQAVVGFTIDATSDLDLEKLIPKVSVYARVSPEHKLRIVKAWKKRGEIVAMTGDGVNDAPAVKAADIGVAMGIAGTDVTKEASSMVLTDDNFASIVNAVEEGRGIFDNIQNIIQFLLAGNTGEILLVLIALLMGWPTPLLAIQILWINLVTDGFPALALATEPPEQGIMKRPPRPVKEPIFTWQRSFRILIHGALLAAVSIFGYWWSLFRKDGSAGDINHAQSVAFCTCAFAQLAYSFSCRSKRYTLPELGIFSNIPLLLAIATSTLLQVSTVLVPWMHPFFYQESPQFDQSTWAMIALLSLLPVSLVEIKKIINSHRFTGA